MFAKLLTLFFGCLAVASCTTTSDEDRIIRGEMYKSMPKSQPLVMTTKIGQETLTMRSEAKFAGAISSLNFRGQEYINSTDHGRLMQGAIAYNGRFECLNPTQAGGSRDQGNLGQRSTSQRLEAYVTRENAIHIKTRMAYWLRPGMMCSIPDEGRRPVENTTRLSDDVYSIRYAFGLNGQANVARLDIAYEIAETYRSAVVEALTIYTPLSFDTFHSVDPASGNLTLEPTTIVEETPAPIILSTADGKHAIAFLSLVRGATYARFRFTDTNKISLVYRDRDGITGRNDYAAAMAIGTRDEVAAQVSTILTSQREFGFAGD